MRELLDALPDAGQDRISAVRRIGPLANPVLRQ
jgi:hypothetical protein